MAGAAGSAMIPLTARAVTPANSASPSTQDPSQPVEVTLRVNGEDKLLNIDARTTVPDALREHIGPSSAAIARRARSRRRWPASGKDTPTMTRILANT
jgi:hypothetical protein